MSKSRTNICRSIHDRHEILAEQVFNLFRESLGEETETTDREFRELRQHVKAVVSKHTDGLVNVVLKELK